MSKYWLINFCCEGAEGGNSIVRADTLMDAWNKFIQEWEIEYTKDVHKFISPFSLETINIKPLKEDIINFD